MEEIIGKIVLCLVIALLLGFLIGWLFAKALGKQEEPEEEVTTTFADLDNKLSVDLAEMEVKYEKEKALAAEYANRNRELKGELMKKISLLESTSATLKNLQSDALSQQDTGSNFALERVAELEKELAKKSREVAEFETVLVKAEETIERLSKKN